MSQTDKVVIANKLGYYIAEENEVVYKQGDRGDHIYIIFHGSVIETIQPVSDELILKDKDKACNKEYNMQYLKERVKDDNKDTAKNTELTSDNTKDSEVDLKDTKEKIDSLTVFSTTHVAKTSSLCKIVISKSNDSSTNLQIFYSEQAF